VAFPPRYVVEGIVVVNAHTARPAGRVAGRRTLLLLALLLVALGSVAYGLASVIRDVEAWLLLSVAALGMLSGWALAAPRLPGWLGGTLALPLGVAVVLLRVGRLEGDLVTALLVPLRLYGQTWRWLLSGVPPDWAALLLPLTELWDDVGALASHLLDWALAGQLVFDLTATALVWSAAVWAVSFWAGWKLRRCQPLQGMAPAGGLLAVVLYYAGTRAFFLLPFLGAALLLTPLIGQDARERRWRSSGISFSRDVWMNVARVAASLSLALVVTAVLTPSVSVQEIVELAQRFSGEEKGEADSLAESLGLASQSGPEAAVFNRVRVASLPRSHLIGGDPQLSRRVVMLIRTGDMRPDLAEAPHRYYWRSITYDRYTGYGWATSQTEIREYGPGELAMSEDVPFRRVVQQDVQVLGDLGQMLHVAGDLVTVDSSYWVAFRPDNDAFGATSEATMYHAESLVPTVGEAQLRSAGQDYPEWVLSRYLSLPADVPERVLALARDLTTSASTPYDRALAIESYLRGFPYSLDVPAPPPDRDIADYFLFDLQEGYCDYYATAMVVLARTAGLPARLAVGYAGGTYDPANGRFIVTEANAHAWAEVYFPGYGWIEFEPTGGRPAIERPAGIEPFEWPEGEEPSEAQERTRPAPKANLGRLWWLWVPGGLAALSLAAAVWSAVAWRRLRFLSPTAVAEVLYRRLWQHAQRLDVPLRAGNTPYEFAASFAERIERLAQGGRWSAKTAAEEIHRLVEFYVRASYTPRPPDAADRAEAIQTWQRLRRRLWLAWVRRRWPKRSRTVGRSSTLC